MVIIACFFLYSTHLIYMRVLIVAEDSNSSNMQNHTEEDVYNLSFVDETHLANTLSSLNMMRKNRHFCDVILHVCALAVQHHILHILIKQRTQTFIVN